jgi:hypothetical protein
MIPICPNIVAWRRVYERLGEFARQHAENQPLPIEPPYGFYGWETVNDFKKRDRWRTTVAWALKYGCGSLISEIPDHEYYFVPDSFADEVAPTGEWNPKAYRSIPSTRPTSERLAQLLEILRMRWPDIAGPELAAVTRPLAFAGDKGCRLVVFADPSAKPPWGDWRWRSEREVERRTFTRFRAAVNTAIAPHGVDHISFTSSRGPDAMTGRKIVR